MNLRKTITKPPTEQEILAKKKENIIAIHNDLMKITATIGHLEQLPLMTTAYYTLKWAELTKCRIEQILQREVSEIEICFYAGYMEKIASQISDQKGTTSKFARATQYADTWKLMDLPSWDTHSKYLELFKQLDDVEEESNRKTYELFKDFTEEKPNESV